MLSTWIPKIVDHPPGGRPGSAQLDKISGMISLKTLFTLIKEVAL
jgi:hypothetical protein